MIGKEFPPINFQNIIANLIEEITVVGYHKKGDTCTGKIAFKPFYHLQIKMVGRLIKEEEVGLTGQYNGQGNTLTLPTTQLPHGLFGTCNLQLGEVLARLHACLFRREVLEAHLFHRLFWCKNRFLLQKSHLGVFAIDDGTLIGRFLSGKDSEQG